MYFAPLWLSNKGCTARNQICLQGSWIRYRGEWLNSKKITYRRQRWWMQSGDKPVTERWPESFSHNVKGGKIGGKIKIVHSNACGPQNLLQDEGTRPSGTVWGSSCEGLQVHTLILMSSFRSHNKKEHHDDDLLLLWGHFEWFWMPSGRIFGPFWAHVELKNRLGSSLGALFVLEIVFTSRTPTILEGFGDLLDRFLEIFLHLFWI